MSLPRRIFLAGMMGSGKSRVGRLLAERLGRPFVDLDARLEAETGASVAELFAAEGEAGFRARERDGLRRLLQALMAEDRAAVVALGGGSVLDPANRERLMAAGALVGLRARPASLAARLRAEPADTRPLLAAAVEAGGDPVRALEQRLAHLLHARQPAYDALPLQVATDGRSPEDVAEAILNLLAGLRAPLPRCLPVRRPGEPGAGYTAFVGPGLLDELGPRLAALGLGGRVLLVSDTRVAPLYAERALDSLREAGLRARLATMGQGEPAKTLDSVRALYEGCREADLDRDGLVIALGGGVVGDTAGFVAATWLRGLRLVQVPTSLLAMVDAALGGKVGVDLPAGKNLVGAFHHPELVLADTSVLASLPPRELRAGLAELLKTAWIGDPALLERLERERLPAADEAAAWAELVAPAAAVKAAVVGEDPGEQGRRALLNLGHTFAHAIEQVSGYGWLHGEAVAAGLWAAARLSEGLGLAREEGLAARVERQLDRLGLPARCPGLDPRALRAAMRLDKKRREGRLRFVLPRAAGDVRLTGGVPPEALRSVLEELCAQV